MNIIDAVRWIIDKIIPERKKISDSVASMTQMQTERTTRQDFVVAPVHIAAAAALLPGQTLIHGKTPTQHALLAWKMYMEDDRVRAAVDSIAEDAAQRGFDRLPFKFDVHTVDSMDDEVRERVDNLFRRKGVDAYNRVDSIVRKFLVDGSCFYRKIVDIGDDPKIIEWRLIEGARSGFYIHGPLKSDDQALNGGFVQYEISTRQPVNFFFWWEVDAFHWRYDEESGRGLPLMSSGTINWERLSQIERTLATARNYHAFKRILNKINASTADEFERFVAAVENADRNRSANSPFAHYYTNADASVLDTTMNWQIYDVLHVQDKLYASGMMPKGLYGSGGANINRAVLDLQTQRYIDGTVMDAEASFQAGLETLVATELYLIGRSPETTKVTFTWPPKHIVDPRMVTEAGKAVDSGRLSIDTYLQYSFKTSFSREVEKIKFEEEKLAEMAERRKSKIEKRGDTEELNSEETVEVSDDDIDAEIESLLGRSNGSTTLMIEHVR